MLSSLDHGRGPKTHSQCAKPRNVSLFPFKGKRSLFSFPSHAKDLDSNSWCENPSNGSHSCYKRLTISHSIPLW
jgi:hypothetical protein